MRGKRLARAALSAASAAAFFALLAGGAALAAAADAPHLDGRTLGLAWVLPFAGLLLSIAIFPLAAPSFWHHHYGKISLCWSLAFILPFFLKYGAALTLHELMHTLLLEYMPFIILIGALFVVAGGIHMRGNLYGTPGLNTGLIAAGAGIASVIGTTGASMLLIRPVIRANDGRKHNAHVVIFFIFLVSNIGGSLTPIGDPPLFLGFLQGVDFFWPLKNLWAPTLLLSILLLCLFYALDAFFYAKEGRIKPDSSPGKPLALDGKGNIALLIAAAAIVLASGLIQPFGRFHILSVGMNLKDVLRDLALAGIACLSFRLTPKTVHAANVFTWFPAIEVAKLFAGIFITIIPAIAILRAGQDGSMAALLQFLTGADGRPDNATYFWLTGILSSFLDNAPTYLVFFNAAGGDAQQLMGPLAATLTAISAGAVFMGANTYIGNAPNFMVKSIAEQGGVRMPGFFGYMLWSGGILIPCFLLVSWIFFR